MRDPIQSHAALEDWSQILLWCFLMGLAAMLFWVAALFFAGDLAYAVHSRVVPITREQFNMVHYSGLLTTKMILSLFFLLPYISIRMVLRKRAR